jgi:hypothetical protein
MPALVLGSLAACSGIASVLSALSIASSPAGYCPCSRFTKAARSQNSSRRLGRRRAPSRALRSRSIRSATLRRAVARAVGFRIMVGLDTAFLAWRPSLLPTHAAGMTASARASWYYDGLSQCGSAAWRLPAALRGRRNHLERQRVAVARPKCGTIGPATWGPAVRLKTALKVVEILPRVSPGCPPNRLPSVLLPNVL